jgi:hypothetical protein
MQRINYLKRVPDDKVMMLGHLVEVAIYENVATWRMVYISISENGVFKAEPADSLHSCNSAIRQNHSESEYPES